MQQIPSRKYKSVNTARVPLNTYYYYY